MKRYLAVAIVVCCISTVHASATQPPVFALTPDAEKLPSDGPGAWCRKHDVIRNIVNALSNTTAVKGAGASVIDFMVSTTAGMSVKDGTFSCHGVAHISNGQMLPGTFSILKNAAGESIWNWMNDNPGADESISPEHRSTSAMPPPNAASPAVRPGANADRQTIAQVIESIRPEPEWRYIRTDKADHDALGYDYEFTIVYKKPPREHEVEEDTKDVARKVLQWSTKFDKTGFNASISVFVCATQDGLRGETGNALVIPMGCTKYNPNSDQLEFDPHFNTPPSWMR